MAEVLAKKNKKEHFLTAARDLELDGSEELFNKIMNKVDQICFSCSLRLELHNNMKSYFQRILFICMVNLTFTTMTFSQDIGSDWINVRGMSNQQIERLMSEKIPSLKTYAPEVLEKAMKSMNDER